MASFRDEVKSLRPEMMEAFGLAFWADKRAGNLKAKIKLDRWSDE